MPHFSPFQANQPTTNPITFFLESMLFLIAFYFFVTLQNNYNNMAVTLQSAVNLGGITYIDVSGDIVDQFYTGELDFNITDSGLLCIRVAGQERFRYLIDDVIIPPGLVTDPVNTKITQLRDLLFNTLQSSATIPVPARASTTGAAISAGVGAGTVAAGKLSVRIESSTGFIGTVQGVAMDAESYLEFVTDSATLTPAIPYNVTAGTLTIRTIQ